MMHNRSRKNVRYSQRNITQSKNRPGHHDLPNEQMIGQSLWVDNCVDAADTIAAIYLPDDSDD